MRLIVLWRDCPIAICIMILFFSIPTGAQDSSSPYKRLRCDEDFSYLRDTSRQTDLFDPVKYIPLRRDRQDWYLSLGGEIKLRYENWHNPKWGEEGEHESFFLQRYMLHGDFHLGDRTRAFMQLRSALKSGGNPPGPIDEDSFDIHQGFADVSLTPKVTIRAGRQEMLYGSTRLVSVREGANIRRAFDGVKAIIRTGDWAVDGWVTRPVAIEDGSFDQSDNNRIFWGVYAMRPWGATGLGLDLYYMGLARDDAKYNQGTANETRHTLGARFWGIYGGWDYDLELVYQFGDFGNSNIIAWMAATNSGFTFRAAPFRPRIGMKVEAASGDRDPRDDSLQTFNPMFHNSQLFNETDLVGLSNLIDVHPYLTLNPAENFRLTFDWAFFWRESSGDAVYDNFIQIQRPGAGGTARYIGSALSGLARWQVDSHLSMYLAYSHFFTGTFIEQTGPAKDVDFLGFWARYLF